MKKFLVIILSFFAALYLTACVETSSTQSKPIVAVPVNLKPSTISANAPNAPYRSRPAPVAEKTNIESAAKIVTKPTPKRTPINVPTKRVVKKPAPTKQTYTAKSVIEKWQPNTSGKVNRPYVYNPKTVDRALSEPVFSTADSAPRSGMQVVSPAQAKDRLQLLGIDYTPLTLDPNVQLDEIKVTLNKTSANKVVFVEAVDSNQEIVADGRDVVVISSVSRITVTGNCGQLFVVGEKNVVSADSIVSIQVHGNANHLTLGNIHAGELHGNFNRVDWKRPGRKPQVIANGIANEIAEPR